MAAGGDSRNRWRGLYKRGWGPGLHVRICSPLTSEKEHSSWVHSATLSRKTPWPVPAFSVRLRNVISPVLLGRRGRSSIPPPVHAGHNTPLVGAPATGQGGVHRGRWICQCGALALVWGARLRQRHPLQTESARMEGGGRGETLHTVGVATSVAPLEGESRKRPDLRFLLWSLAEAQNPPTESPGDTPKPPQN